MFGTLFASLTAKIAGVALAATLATSALAATGSLPSPAQNAVATVAAKVGISIPDGTSAKTGDGLNGFAGVTPTVTPTVSPSIEPTGVAPTSTASGVVNHGNCVSYAAQAAGTLGLTGSQHGAFVSMIARNSAAVSSPVAAGGVPGAACQAAITQAFDALTNPTPTATVTSTATPAKGNGNGKSGQPHGNNPAARSEPSPTPEPTVSATASAAVTGATSGTQGQPASTPSHPGRS